MFERLPIGISAAPDHLPNIGFPQSHHGSDRGGLKGLPRMAECLELPHAFHRVVPPHIVPHPPAGTLTVGDTNLVSFESLSQLTRSDGWVDLPDRPFEVE